MKKNNPWAMQPQTPASFTPDLIIEIQYRIIDGAVRIRSGNGKPINPTFMCSLLSKIISGNLDAILQQQSLIIQPSSDVPSTQSKFAYPDATGHNFLACTDNAEICQYCGGHVGNHQAEVPNA